MSIEKDTRPAQDRRVRPAWIPLGAFFVLALLLALIARLPASIALAGIERWGGLPETITWERTHGSVWDGGIEGLGMPAGPLGGLQWNVRPGALFHGEFHADIHWTPPGGGELQGILGLAGDRIEIAGLEGSLPAAALHQWDTGIPLVLDGHLQTSGLTLRIRRDGTVENAAGTLSWQHAAAGLPRPLPLGEQRATIRQQDQGLAIDLDAAPDAELAITGTLRLDLRTQPPGIDGRVELAPRDHADAAITRLLDNHLDSDNQGRYQWTTGSAP